VARMLPRVSTIGGNCAARCAFVQEGRQGHGYYRPAGTARRRGSTEGQHGGAARRGSTEGQLGAGRSPCWPQPLMVRVCSQRGRRQAAGRGPHQHLGTGQLASRRQSPTCCRRRRLQQPPSRSATPQAKPQPAGPLLNQAVIHASRVGPGSPNAPAHAGPTNPTSPAPPSTSKPPRPAPRPAPAPSPGHPHKPLIASGAGSA
jgi:hypothetical protein